jgi:hypothetical protein
MVELGHLLGRENAIGERAFQLALIEQSRFAPPPAEQGGERSPKRERRQQQRNER